MSRSVLSSVSQRLSRCCARPSATLNSSHRFFSTSRPSLTISELCLSTAPIARPQIRGLSASGQLRPQGSSSSLRIAIPRSTARRQHVAFASTSARITLNSRTGDDGEILMVDISERAAERLRKINGSAAPTEGEHPYNHLRVTVTSGGCHGFQYIFALEPASKVDPEEDTIFEAAENLAPGPGAARVAVDQPTLELLSGSVVDFTTELIGSQFKVQNPRATSSCGCGTSFDVKD